MKVLCFLFISMNPLKNQSKKENHKMKKRLFALTAMMLCIVMALSSCSLFGSAIKFKNFVDKDFQPDVDPSLTTLEKLDISGNLDDSDGVSKLGNVIILQGPIIFPRYIPKDITARAFLSEMLLPILCSDVRSINVHS